jgi:tetratricopeptide (TPR) repeat protein
LAVLDYFKLLFLPFGLHMERAVSDLGPVYSLKTAIAFLAVSLWAVAAAVFWKKERGIAFGFFWFFILLFPVSGILIKILYPSYEHYLYLPLIGFWLAFFCLARLFFAKLGNGRVLLFSRIFFYVMLIACLVFWGFLTVRRNRDWHDPITFYEKNLKYSPQSFIEHTNLGIAYDEAGRHEEAIAEYEKAISIKDVYPQVHHDLANSLAAVKKYDEAEKEYLRAIEMDRGFIFSYRNLYNLYVFLGEREKAENTFKRLNELK